MNKFYHISPNKNIRNILKNGLLPSRGERSSQLEIEDGIFLFVSLEAVRNALSNWLSDEFDEDEKLALFQVDLDEAIPANHYEIMIKYPIPPQYIKLLTDDIDHYNENLIENNLLKELLVIISKNTYNVQ